MTSGLSYDPARRPATTAAGPLAGLKVIELGGIGPSAFGGMILADLGAEVIRVDRPGAGSGALIPPELDLLNRGKRSIVLDLKKPAAVDAVLDLVELSEVVIEGFRPGVAERLGLGPADVRERNPRVVYGRMTGWGQFGPLAPRAGHDIDYIAITGALAAIGPAGGPPQIPLSLVGDFGGGATYLVIGVLAALREAARTGQGQVIDAAIVDGANHLLTAVHALRAYGTWIDERGMNEYDGGSPFYSVYETGDQRYMAVGAIEPRFYAELLRVLDLDEDPSRQHDRDNWPSLRIKLAGAFRTRSQTEWTTVFEGTDACVAPVLDVAEARFHPQMIARRNVLDIDGVAQPAPAPRFSGHRDLRPPLPVPLGTDTFEILQWVGRQGLLDEGAAVAADPTEPRPTPRTGS
jgi:alpha-methylacyl-CoA racemase